MQWALIAIEYIGITILAVFCLVAVFSHHAGSVAFTAATIEDAGLYFEPPKWYYPIRHSLGAALLKAGQNREAEQVYREDLRRFPDNGWSLFGLSQALRAQGKTKEAAAADASFKKAWVDADVKLTVSRF